MSVAGTDCPFAALRRFGLLSHKVSQIIEENASRRLDHLRLLQTLAGSSAVEQPPEARALVRACERPIGLEMVW